MLTRPPASAAGRRVSRQAEDAGREGQQGEHGAVCAVAKDDKVALFTKIEARIQDPSGKYDNIPVFDSWFSTYLNRDGSTKVSTLLSKLGRTVPPRASHKVLMDELVTALASEPDVIIETQWEASCQTCTEEAKKNGGKRPRSIQGMKKFPLLPGSRRALARDSLPR
jgi:hypothetical protein